VNQTALARRTDSPAINDSNRLQTHPRFNVEGRNAGPAERFCDMVLDERRAPDGMVDVENALLHGAWRIWCWTQTARTSAMILHRAVNMAW
jgi:hypothetical protein